MCQRPDGTPYDAIALAEAVRDNLSPDAVALVCGALFAVVRQPAKNEQAEAALKQAEWFCDLLLAEIGDTGYERLMHEMDM
jgi:poly-beta-hydroxyalkanoate depolymerase